MEIFPILRSFLFFHLLRFSEYDALLKQDFGKGDITIDDDRAAVDFEIVYIIMLTFYDY